MRRLAAIGSDEDAAAFTDALPRARARDGATPDDDYAELLRELLGASATTQVDAFIDAEHEVVAAGASACSARRRRCSTSLRSRGIKTGVVANSWPEPARLLRARRGDVGLAELLDVSVFSAEVGARKPAAGDLPARAGRARGRPARRDVRRRPARRRCARRGESGHDDRSSTVVQRRRHTRASSRTSWPSRRWTC